MAKKTSFGEHVRGLRMQADLGLREAAKKIGISPSYLSRLEADEFRPPSGEVLLRMGRTYGCDIKELMDVAKSRQDEVMAADADAAPALRSFYRLAHDQTREVQEKMLTAAVGALGLPPEKEKELLARLRDELARSMGKDLTRLATGDHGLFAFDITPRALSREMIRRAAAHVTSTVLGATVRIPVPIETIVEKVDPDIIFRVADEIEGGRLRDGSPAVLGFSRWAANGRQRELVIHEELFACGSDAGRRRANFTLAHELFHCLEHLPLVQARHPRTALGRKVASVSVASRFGDSPWFDRNRGARVLFTSEDWREWQANQFAAELLMPEEGVRETFEVMFDAPYLIAEDCGVQEFADRVARSRGIDDAGDAGSLVEQFDVNPHAMALRLMKLNLVSAKK